MKRTPASDAQMGMMFLAAQSTAKKLGLKILIDYEDELFNLDRDGETIAGPFNNILELIEALHREQDALHPLSRN